MMIKSNSMKKMLLLVQAPTTFRVGIKRNSLDRNDKNSVKYFIVLCRDFRILAS